MLELFDAQVAPNNLIQVKAMLDGVPAPFHVAPEVIADILRLQEYDLASCKAKLEDEWDQLADPLERLLRKYGVATLITSEMLIP
ncbi:hypothetical protein ACFFU8_18365 [Chromobacterium piscinae]|uniref:hypothetical protein n=1 Tax=Chromobacterium piscinae TaxID=686831 RepID=UPI001E2F41F6|nr:hypothetical protein [Chromobacterium piscinae]MCD5326719.1 hypothetical protein [Chromobacterium piscinae]